MVTFFFGVYPTTDRRMGRAAGGWQIPWYTGAPQVGKASLGAVGS